MRDMAHRESRIDQIGASMHFLFYKGVRGAEPGAKEGPGGPCHFRIFFCKQMSGLSVGYQVNLPGP